MIKRPGVILAIGVMLGILAAELFAMSPRAALTVGAFSLLLYVIARKYQSYRALTLALVLLTGSLGAYRAVTEGRSDNLRYFFQEDESRETLVRLRGEILQSQTVFETPEDRQGQDISADSWWRIQSIDLAAESILTDSGWRAAQGGVRLAIHGKQIELIRGDRVEILCKAYPLRAPLYPGDFDSRKYYQRQGIYFKGTVSDAGNVVKLESGSRTIAGYLDRVKQDFLRKLEENAGDSTARMTAAVVFGEKDALDLTKQKLFSASGTGHILAVSGLHTAFLAFAFWHLFRLLRVPPKWRAILIMVIIVLFTTLTGWKASVARAAIAVLVVLGGRFFRRETDLLNNLGIAALIILLWRPFDLFDPGFQMSFLAVLGLILMAPRLEKWYYNWNKFPRELVVEPWEKFKVRVEQNFVSMVTVGIAAWLAVLPLTLYYFNMLTPQGIIANLILVPLSSVLLLVGIVAFMLSFIWMGFAAIAAPFCSALNTLTLWSLEVFAWLVGPYEYFPDPGAFAILIYFVVMFLWTSDVGWFKRKSVRIVSAVAVLTLWAALMFYRPAQGDELHFIPSWNTQSALLRLSTGENILFDAGANESYDHLTPYLLRCGVRRLDAVVLSHPHQDHAGDLPELFKKFRIGKIVLNSAEKSSRLTRTILAEARRRVIPVVSARSGEKLQLGQNAKLKILFPPPDFKLSKEDNSGSMVALLELSGFSFLFPGDADKTTWDTAAKNLPESVNVFVLPHHGTKKDYPKDVIEKLKPEILVRNGGSISRATLTVSSEEAKPAAFYDATKGVVIMRIENGQLFRWQYHPPAR